jgi:hypothetical protein
MIIKKAYLEDSLDKTCVIGLHDNCAQGDEPGAKAAVTSSNHYLV